VLWGSVNFRFIFGKVQCRKRQSFGIAHLESIMGGVTRSRWSLSNVPGADGVLPRNDGKRGNEKTIRLHSIDGPKR